MAHIAALTAEFDDIVAATTDGNSDDEHDPEGSTLAFERARVSALAQPRTRIPGGGRTCGGPSRRWHLRPLRSVWNCTAARTSRGTAGCPYVRAVPDPTGVRCEAGYPPSTTLNATVRCTRGWRFRKRSYHPDDRLEPSVLDPLSEVRSRERLSCDGGYGSTTVQPRRRSSTARCSEAMSRSTCSRGYRRHVGTSTDFPASDSGSRSRSKRTSASVRVNFPAAWRCVKPIGPRASRKSLCPASCNRVSSSCTCLAEAGGPCCCPNAMASSLADPCDATA